MRVTIDPTGLMNNAVVLASSATELAEAGSALWSCVGCQMPPEVRRIVDDGIARVDHLLDGAADRLRAEAGDLGRRALIAVNDPVTATTVTFATPAPVGASNLIGGHGAAPVDTPSPIENAGMIGGGYGTTTVSISGPPIGNASLIGGFGTETITTIGLPIGNAGLIGGFGTTTITTIGLATGNAGLIGGPSAGRGTTDPVASMVRGLGGIYAGQAARVEGLIASAEASGPAGFNAALNAQAAVADELSHQHLVPGASALGTQGHRGTTVEVRRPSPLTLPAGLR